MTRPTLAQCGWCGKRLPLTPPGTPGPPKVYCAAACQQEAANRDRRAATAARGPRGRYCYRCWRTFLTPRVGRPRITCSSRCARRRLYALWKARTRGTPDLFTTMETR